MLVHSDGTLLRNSVVPNLVLTIMQGKLCHMALIWLYFYPTSH